MRKIPHIDIEYDKNRRKIYEGHLIRKNYYIQKFIYNKNKLIGIKCAICRWEKRKETKYV